MLRSRCKRIRKKSDNILRYYKQDVIAGLNEKLVKEQITYDDFVLKIKDEQNGSIYDEIGKKVKTLAKVTCIVEAVLSVISGFIMIATDEEYILVGLIAMVVGPIVAWVSSWVLYAFGELVDKTCANEQHNKELLEIMKENYKK